MNNFAIIGAILDVILYPPVWIISVLVLAFLTWQNTRKARIAEVAEYALLRLEIPRANDKKELAAEQMFASLHGILRPRKELVRAGQIQEHISFEIASIGNQIYFYIWTPKHLQSFVEGQVYAQYPTVQIYELSDDYSARDFNQKEIAVTEVVLKENEVLPIKTFPNFEVDPLAGLTATLAKLEDDEEMWIQVMARPVDDNWHKKGERFVERIKSGGGFFGGGGFGYFGQVFWALFRPPDEVNGKPAAKEISERDKSRITAIEEKTKKLGYQVKVRIAYLGTDQHVARLRTQAMIGTFKQFNTTNLNSFIQGKTSHDENAIVEYRSRLFIDNAKILNIEELASLFHLPHTNVETPNIVWATSKTAEPPPTLPVVDADTQPGELSPFGITNFRGSNLQFGLHRTDRGRHLYVIGQTGVGKSGLLQLLTMSDVFDNQGFAVIDPHGDYAMEIMKYIPPHRVNDVVYFNPADMEFPVAFNPMEVTDESLKNHISSELVGVLKRMFDSWGPRLEYILRYTILALLDYPKTTMLDITRMLTEPDFRAQVVNTTKDPVVRNFWVNEFASWNEKFATEAVAPVLNKVGAFTANPMVRNIVGQPESSFNIREIMDEGKILMVNLSRGLVGEDNAAILGALMVTKVQLAAMSRADIENIDDRRPFYLYVDEFQNFATDSFAVILSEARKYGLNLTVANQYVSQMEPVVRDAVFGNVGSLISFRVGADDAASLEKYFSPQFDAADILQLHNRNFVASLSIAGEKTPAFSAKTLNIPGSQQDSSEEIIQQSRQKYAKPKAEVEATIENFVLPSVTKAYKSAQRAPKQPKTVDEAVVATKAAKKQPKSSPDGTTKTKRKRTRSRRKSKTTDDKATDTTQKTKVTKKTPKQKTIAEEETVNLR